MMTNLKITTPSGTVEIPDSGYLRGLGIVCPKTPLHIREMTEIEKTEGEIKVLQAKLELLKEMEKHKSPCEEAYKEVYGYYPPTTPNVSNFMDNRWSAFQKGYNASKEDCKVEEPKPETLYDLIGNWWDNVFVVHNACNNETSIDYLVNDIEKWLPYEIEHEDGDYAEGWNNALRIIKDKLR